MIKNYQRKGIIRNKYELLIIQKQNINKKNQPRFRKVQSRFSKNYINHLNQKAQSQNIQKSLIQQSQSKDLELTTMSSLPPQWMDRYEECSSLLKEVNQIKKQISALNSKRLTTIRQSQQIALDKQIFNKATQATRKIHLCDNILKQVLKEDKSDQIDKKLCQNMCKALVIEIQQKTKQLRTQQKSYIQQRRRLDNSAKVEFLELAVDKVLNEDYQQESQQLQQQYLEQQNLTQRNSQILKIVNSINELGQIYRQLQNLVLIQGTLLDRIDFNIQQTVKHVQKGNNHLTKAIQHQKSPIACRCIGILIIIILVLGILLSIKYLRN